MMKLLKICIVCVLCTLVLFLFAGCVSSKSETFVEDSTIAEQMYEIITDDPFA